MLVVLKTMKIILKSAGLGLLLVASALPLRAEITARLTNQPLPGVTFQEETRTNPPTRFFVAEVDLSTPRLHLRVAPGGSDPDGSGPWETTLMEPTRIADREKFDLVINGDFFVARNIKDAEGAKAGYRADQWALTEGPAVTDGRVWSASTNARPCLVVHTNGSVAIELVSQPTPDDWQVIAGNTILLQDGQVIPHKNIIHHPRTVVGLDATGKKLTILLVDGRKPGIAVGMSYDELGVEMQRLGCRVALNLDCGGSSVLAVRDPGTGKMKILNEPTDGHERAVADVLGITVGR